MADESQVVEEQDLKLTVEGSKEQVSATFVAASRMAGRPVALVLGHGLSNDKDHPVVRDTMRLLAGKGIFGLRFNFPFREHGRPKADSREVLHSTFLSGLAWVADRIGDPGLVLLMGGKSLAARMAVDLQASSPVAHGLVYLGYPLHPPGRMDKARSESIGGVSVPQLFMVGDSDPYCDMGLLTKILSGLGSPWKLEVIQNAEHSLGVADDASDARSREVIEDLAGRTMTFLEEHFPASPTRG